MICIVKLKFHDKNRWVVEILWIFFLTLHKMAYTMKPLSHYAFPCLNSASTIVLIWFTNEHHESVQYSSKVIWKLQWRVSTPIQLNSQPAKTPNLAYLAPIIFCPAASAGKTVRQISPGSAELSVLPSLSCQQPPTRQQVPDDWLKTEADEWWHCWVASASSESDPTFTLGFPSVFPQSANCHYPNGWNSWACQTWHDNGACMVRILKLKV